jgi:hypothetical protein
MPLTTPFVPLTVSFSSAPSPSAVFVDSQPPSAGPRHTTARNTTREPADDAEQTDQFVSAAPDPPPSFTAPPAARPSTHSRRLTLSRFPLLRNKSSRELARSPSILKSSTAPPPTHSLLATARPRTSTSTLRGRQTSPSRAPSVHGHERDTSEEADPPTRTAPANKDKMHQTSSRLLRMTDDERPYTRVCVPPLPSVSTCLWPHPSFFGAAGHQYEPRVFVSYDV